MPSIRIEALGSSRIWRRGQLLNDDAWRTAKSRMLFLLLLNERGHPVPKDRILDYLWRNLPPKQAQNNLWVTTSQVRKALEPELPPRSPSRYIITSPEAYAFDTESDYWLDVDEFSSHLQFAHQSVLVEERIKAMEAARRLYRGDYLEELPYEEWVLPARERLRSDFMTLLADLADSYAGQGQFRRAIALCLESLALDRAQESVYRFLMLYYYCIGEQAAALKTYDECVRILRDELAVEPMPETVDLDLQIQRGAVVGVDQRRRYPQPTRTIPTAHGVSRTPFIGREQSYDELAARLAELDSGRGCIALIEGEAGIGKSRLVQEVMGFAFAQGHATLLARCYQVEQGISYQSIIDLLRHLLIHRPNIFRELAAVWLAEIAVLIPELSQVVPNLPKVPLDVGENRQARLFHAVAELVKSVSGEKGLLLVFDDIHWADSSTLQFLHYLALRLADQPILLACTFRGEEVAASESATAFLHSIARTSHLLKIRLDRLSLTDVYALLDQMSRSSPRVRALGEWFYHETEGNPFFLVTILQSLFEQGQMTMSAQGEWNFQLQDLYAKGINLTLPEALRDSLRERLRRVPKRARPVLELAAVLGSRFDLNTLQKVATQDAENVVDALDDLATRQLLYEKQDRTYEFTHDKIREVVYYDMTSARRALLHRRVAEMAEHAAGGQLDENAALVAYHYERTGQNDKALAYWLRAGQHALKAYAPQQAAEHYGHALALAEAATDRTAAYWGLGQAHFALDQFEASIADLNQALQLVDGADDRRAKILYQLADVHFAHYQIEASEAYAQAARQAAEAAGDWETVAESLSLLGQVQSARGSVAAENELIVQALTICRRAGNRWREGRTLADLGWLQAQRSEFAHAIESATAARQILEETDDRAGVAFVWNILGRAHGGCGNYSDAFAAFRHSQEIAQTIDHKFLLSQAPNMLAWLCQQLGDYQQAQILDEKGVAQARAWRKMPAEISGEINLALDRLFLGEPARALAHLSEIKTRIEKEAIGFHAWRWRLRLLHAEGLGHLALGNAAVALPLAEEGLALAEKTTSGKYVALNRFLRGAALADLGQSMDALREIQMAVTLADEMGYQPLRWQARHRLARLHDRLERPEQARAQIEQAAQIIRSIAERLDDEPLREAFLRVEVVGEILQTKI